MLLKSYSSIDGLHVIREESTPDIEMAAFTEQLRELRESVERIVERNKMKDLGKDFETSYTRMIVIMLITYCTLFLYMKYVLVVNYPALNAIVPTIGFNLSTWSLPYVKNYWLKYRNVVDPYSICSNPASQ